MKIKEFRKFKNFENRRFLKITRKRVKLHESVKLHQLEKNAKEQEQQEYKDVEARAA